MDNQTIELVSSKDSKTGAAGRKVNGVFSANDSSVSNTINSDSLRTQPEITIPPLAPATGTTGLAATIESESDSFTQNLEQQRRQAEQTQDVARNDLVSTFRDQLTESEAQFQAEDTLGVGGLEQDLIDINNQINAERMSRRRRIESLEKNPEGLFGGALEDKIADVELESIRKEADLSVIALARQGKFDAAQARANKAVDALLERQKQELDIAQFLYTENKELFTLSEQREFTEKQGDRVRKLNAEEADMKALQSAKLEAMKMAQLNGAPASVLAAIQESESPVGVFAAGGKYASGDLLDRMYKQAQIANIYDTINSRTESLRKQSAEASSNSEKEQKKKEADTESALGIKELAGQLLTDRGMSSAVGFGLRKSIVGSIPFVSGDAVAGTSRADFEATATRLANLLTLDNLDLMSGVLSETDIKILETAGSNLGNYNQSEKQYREEVQRILDVATRVVNKNGLTEEQSLFWGIVEEPEIDEINAIFE